jgi:opacity protein-like surface antigen
MQKLFVLAAVALVASVALGATPRFVGPLPVMDGSSQIDVGYYGAPSMADWNEDGARDLVIGQFDYGKIRLYLNQGQDRMPRFDGYEFYQSGGTDITLPYG